MHIFIQFVLKFLSNYHNASFLRSNVCFVSAVSKVHSVCCIHSSNEKHGMFRFDSLDWSLQVLYIILLGNLNKEK